MREAHGKRSGASTRLTTATNIVVILVAGAMALDGNGPIRTQFGTWVDQYRDRRTAEEMWASVTEGLDRFVGGDSAPIAVVEFTDYQCPYCRRMDVIKQQANIADVRVVIRHLPLERLHPNASLAAQISICTEALAPADWLKVHRLLYQTSDSLHVMDWPNRLRSIGLPGASEIETCVQSDLPSQRLAEDRQYAELYRITGTPSYVFPKYVQRGAVDADKWVDLLTAAGTHLSLVEAGESR